MSEDIKNEKRDYRTYSFSVSVLKLMSILFFLGGLYGFVYYGFIETKDINRLFENNVRMTAAMVQQAKITSITIAVSIGLSGITTSAVLSLFIGIFKKIVWNESD